MAVAALIITLPALKGNSAGDPFPFAFFAVVSITVIGLYIAYAIPIFLRWRAGQLVRAVAGLEPRQQVALDEPVRGLLGRVDHDHLLPPVHAGGGAVERRGRRRRQVQLGGAQLRAADGRRGDPVRGDRLARSRRRTTSPARRRNIDIDKALTAEGDDPPPPPPAPSLSEGDARGAQEGGRGRHGRHRAARDRRHGGPAPGQAADGEPLPRRGARARRRGLQLPARRRRRHGDGRRLRDGVVGARLRRLRDEARPRHAAARSPGTRGRRCVLADLAWADGNDVVASPRQILRRQLARLAERGWTANAGTELEFIVFNDTYEEAWKKAYRDLEPANLYNIDYSLLGSARVEPLIRRIRNEMARRRDDGRELEGRVQPRPARDQLPLRRGARRRRRPRRLQERRQGDRRPGGDGDHLHGEVQRAPRATRATSTARSRTRTARTRSPPTGRCSTASSPASSPAWRS